MSYSYERVDRRSRTTGRGGYGAASRRSTLGYWVPLVMTVTVATMGLAAWIWSERRDDEDENGDEEQPPADLPPPGYASMSGGLPPGPGPTGFQGPLPAASMGPDGFEVPTMPQPAPGYEGGARSTGVDTQIQNDGTLMSKMSGALKRTPSPQQSYDWASKKVAAGVAAAGAMVGGALNTIREGNQDDYEDHERWSEEADSRNNGRDGRNGKEGKEGKDGKEVKRGLKRRGTADDYFSGAVEMPQPVAIKSRKRKNIAVVVSAVEGGGDRRGEVDQHAVCFSTDLYPPPPKNNTNGRQSILAHLPEYINPMTTRVFVLIYAPELKAHPLSAVSTSKPAYPITQGSTTSSFSNISHTDAHTPGEFPPESDSGLPTVDPNPVDESSSLFKTLFNQALAVVENDTMIMPFTTRAGHLHLLRSLAPETVYMQETLCGDDGEMAASLSGWVKQIVVVIGDEGGHGGLVDTEDEDGLGRAGAEHWWQREDRTGLGRSVAVVESLKIGDDWKRRIGEHD
jgi:hypothetical protein